MKDDIWNMNLALEQAEKAFSEDEVPVGAIIVNSLGQVVSSARNYKEENQDPTGHAELIAIQDAAKKIGNWRLTGHTLYVTLEPCSMCMGAIIQSRIDRVVFGAYDPKGGSLSIGQNIHSNPKLNHKVSVTGGVKHHECSRVLSTFFRQKRSSYKLKSKK